MNRYKLISPPFLVRGTGTKAKARIRIRCSGSSTCTTFEEGLNILLTVVPESTCSVNFEPGSTGI